MSQTLYRKYRSQRFAEIIGQGPVVRILRNSIARGRLNHAYLFSGPRGTGKTSIARIFAKALNCLNPQDGDACGVCENCVAITEGRALSAVIEIDAASNRGIDDIRELREMVKLGTPAGWNYKVYVIDEVHMITSQGFNALLKTLEEPPEHVIFCLCTTEANKVPVTILSRCIRFDFQRLPLPELAAHLEWIAAQEGFELETGCGLKLAGLAEGSARDAISLLDQLTVFCDKQITSRDVDELFQLGDPAIIRAVVDSLAEADSASALSEWERLMERGVDAGTFLLELAGEIKARYLSGDEDAPRLKTALDAVWQGLNLLKYDSFPALLVELTLIQAAAGSNLVAASQVAAASFQRRDKPPAGRSVPQIERSAVTQAAASAPEENRDSLAVSSQPIAEPAEDVRTTATIAEPEHTADGSVLERYKHKLHSIRVTTHILVDRGAHDAWLEDNRLVLVFGDNRQAYSFAHSNDNLAVLREAARQLFGQHTVLEMRRESEHQPPYSAPTNGARVPPGLGSDPLPPTPALEPESSELESTQPQSNGERLATFEDAERLFGNRGGT